MSKKILALLMTVLLVLTTLVMAGCSSGGEKTEEDTKEVTSVDYPTKPVRIIVPFAAGGFTDVNARKLAEVITEEKLLPQPVLVVNMNGANTVEALNTVVNADPDGHTLFIHQTAFLGQYHLGNIPYSYKDLKTVAQTIAAPILLVASKDSPYNTIEELLAYIKEHPGEVKLGIPGFGNFSHITTLAFFKEAGVWEDLKLVMYQSGADSLAGHLGGQCDVRLSTTTEAMRYIESGDFKCLLATGPSSSEMLKDIPTMGGLGYGDFMLLQGIYAPKDTPDEIVQIVGDAIKKAYETDSYQKYLVENAADLNSFADAETFKANLDELDARIKPLAEYLKENQE
jgi:tripartite-type tricarboxylate transporter receptor subunit TctC